MLINWNQAQIQLLPVGECRLTHLEHSVLIEVLLWRLERLGHLGHIKGS